MHIHKNSQLCLGILLDMALLIFKKFQKNWVFFQILDSYFDFLVGFNISNCLWFKTIGNWWHIHKISQLLL